MNLDKIVKTFVIAGAQAHAGVNNLFLKSLETYCNLTNAELLILPMHGKHISEEKLSKKLYTKNVFTGDLSLNNKIKIKDYKVKPQAIRPLTGLESLVKGDKSAIIAGTKINLRAVPNSNTRMAKFLISTGAITFPNYNTRFRQGKIAQQDHEYGAIVVEVMSNKKYHLRYVHSLKNGVFYDMGLKFDGEHISNARPTALIPGDIHTLETDPKALEATIKMIKELQPHNIFLHDFFNGSSISHHNLNDIIELQYNYKHNRLSLEYELSANADQLKTFLHSAPSDCTLYLVASNHNEALTRYLREGRFINEPQNAEIGCDLLKSAFQGKNPLETGIGYFMDIPDNVVFLDRGEDVRMLGIYLSEHGDKGANGTRGSPNVHSRTLEKSISGHSHTSFKYRNTVKVGTISYLQQRYNQGGTSNWTQTNGILHPNGKTQLLNIVDGKYKGKRK